MKMERLLISACLLGVQCRYDGGGVLLPEAEALRDRFQLIPVCAEIYGGLPTPRVPAELRDGRVVTRDGRDVTAEFRRGAEEILRLARFFDCHRALLKARSPSCGVGTIYDGTFSGTRTAGNGVLARLLLDEGLELYTEDQVSQLLKP
jgi:uncharacterized protein YbbK (DUF523 family)